MGWDFDEGLQKWVRRNDDREENQSNPSAPHGLSFKDRQALRKNNDDSERNDLTKIDTIMQVDNSDYELESGSNRFPTLQSISDAYQSGELRKAFHSPHDGALLIAVKKNPKKIDMMALAMQALAVYKSDEGSIAGYIIGRFFLSNADARSFAEAVKALAEDSGVEDVLVAFKLFGLNVKERSDIDRVMLDLYSAHPWIKGLIKQ